MIRSWLPTIPIKKTLPLCTILRKNLIKGINEKQREFSNAVFTMKMSPKCKNKRENGIVEERSNFHLVKTATPYLYWFSSYSICKLEFSFNLKP